MQMEVVLNMEHSGLVQLIEADKREDLARIYRLCKRTGQTGMLYLKHSLHAHVKQVGLVRPLQPPWCPTTRPPPPEVHAAGLICA